MAVAKYWNGSAWAEARWLDHDGSGWVERGKVWDGAEWVPIGGVEPPVFDAVGAGGSSSGSSSSRTLTWSHDAQGENRFALVGLATAIPQNLTSVNAQYGGNPMTALPYQPIVVPESVSGRRVQWFVLPNPPTGPATVQVVITHPTAFGVAVANSVSYTNVGGYVQGESAQGDGADRTHEVTTQRGEMVVQAFAHQSSTGIFDYSQTQRFSGAGGTGVRILMGDTDDTGGVVEFYSRGAGTDWAGVSVRLQPAG